MQEPANEQSLALQKCCTTTRDWTYLVSAGLRPARITLRGMYKERALMGLFSLC